MQLNFFKVQNTPNKALFVVFYLSYPLPPLLSTPYLSPADQVRLPYPVFSRTPLYPLPPDPDPCAFPDTGCLTPLSLFPLETVKNSQSHFFLSHDPITSHFRKGLLPLPLPSLVGCALIFQDCCQLFRQQQILSPLRQVDRVVPHDTGHLVLLHGSTHPQQVIRAEHLGNSLRQPSRNPPRLSP
jgi:hypothetical protein